MRKLTGAALATIGISAAVMYLMKTKAFVTKGDNSEKEDFYTKLKSILSEKEAEFEERLSREIKRFEKEKETLSKVHAEETEGLLKAAKEDRIEKEKLGRTIQENSEEYARYMNALRAEYEEKLKASEEAFEREARLVKAQEEKMRELEIKFEQAKKQNVHVADIPSPDVRNDYEDTMNLVNANSQNISADIQNEHGDAPEVGTVAVSETEEEASEPVSQDEAGEDISPPEEETTMLDEKEKLASRLFKKTGDIKIFLHQQNSQGERFNFVVRFDKLDKEDVNVIFLDSKEVPQEAALKVYDNCVYFSLAAGETMLLKDIPENTIFTISQVKYEGYITKATRMTNDDLAKAVRKIGDDVFEDEKQNAVIEYFERTKKLVERNEIANASVKADDELDTYLFVNRKPGEEVEKPSLRERFSKMFS